MIFNSLYYSLKPFIPRRLQIAIRRQIILRKRAKYAHVWPIDESAGKAPEGWKGWPEGKKFAIVLTHDVETAKGLSRCRQLAELEESLGFRSSFNFVAEDYEVPDELIHFLKARGFEVGVHGLHHRGNLFGSKKNFRQQAERINQWINKWEAKGFRTPSLYHNLDWISDLDILYDSSTFDTDPFEPQPDGLGTIFPLWVSGNNGQKGYVELPYTLPQDFTLFALMGEKDTKIWKRKLEWIAEKGGMALLLTHPDYMAFGDKKYSSDQYSVRYYEELLNYIKQKYDQEYWLILPRDMAEYLKPKIKIIKSMRDSEKQEMNVCIIAYTFYDVDFRVRRYCEALAEAGYKVDVFALRRKGQSKKEIHKRITIYYLQGREYNEKGLTSYLAKMGTFFGKVFFVTFVKYLQKRYKIIHIHNPPDFLVFSVMLPKLLGAKIIFDMHENLPEFFCAKFNTDINTLAVRLLLRFEKMATQFADLTITAHDLLRERVLKRDKIPEEKCLALLNYPQKAFFEALPEQNERNGFKIVYPGTVSYQHGVDIAIRAMVIVKQECESATLDIYVRSSNADYMNKLMKLIDGLGLKKNVFFHKPVPMDNMSAIMQGASIGVVPKRGGIFGDEAFSTKILELMAAGLPVVVSRTKIDEYYFDDSLVLFFKSEDHADLAEHILDLYRHKKKREVLAKMGKAFIEANNWEVKSELYLDKVRELIG